MYGAEDSSTYEETHKNTNDSTIKTYVDNWYKTNLNGYTSYMSTTAGFCNDRSVAPAAKIWHKLYDTALGYGRNDTYYGAFHRLSIYKPQFKCPQANDLFTITTSTKGNKALTYPVGLLTTDEIIYAGAVEARDEGVKKVNHYLNNDTGYTTMSVASTSGLNIYYSYNGLVGSPGTLSGVRPVINLSSDVETISGNGTINNPYVVK